MRPSWKLLVFAVAALLLAAASYLAWQRHQGDDLPAGIVSANGRVEATEVDVATKLPGRIVEVLADEGDSVEAGQRVARMDTDSLEAELQEAQADVLRTQESRKVAEAVVAQRESECEYAEKQLARTSNLYRQRSVSAEQLDRDRTSVQVARMACAAAKAEVVAIDAATAAAQAKVGKLEVEIADAALKAPRGGRVLFRLAEPGEVLAAGGKVLTIVDLEDVYMTVFLPAGDAGRIRIGGEARIVLDALPDRPFDARVSFVADKAQFTPKQVETAEERAKLMFRAKVHALGNADGLLKPGMPGLAYIRTVDAEPWPPHLE